MAAVSISPHLAHTPLHLIMDPTPILEGLEEMSTIPENQRRELAIAELINLQKFLSMDLTYQQSIKFPNKIADVTFRFSLSSFLLTLFQRLYADKVLTGVFIKGGTNRNFYFEPDRFPYDIDCHFQLKENERDLDGLILSCFAHSANITYSDTQGKNCTYRTYWQGKNNIAEIAPAPPRPPNFSRFHECGRFFVLENGLGNYCIVKEKTQKFYLYSIYVFHKDKPLKMDIHVVEKLEHYSFCSQNSMYTAIHPYLYALSKDLPVDKIKLWVKTADNYPIFSALKDLEANEFEYDPPSKVLSLMDGLLIHFRLLSKGNTCRNKGILPCFKAMFLTQYFVGSHLNSFLLEKSLHRELKDHFQDPFEMVCFILNLDDWHMANQIPDLEEIRKIHLKLLGNILSIECSVGLFHFCKVQAFIYDCFVVKNFKWKKKIYLNVPLTSLIHFLEKKEEIFSQEKGVAQILQFFPLQETQDFSTLAKNLIVLLKKQIKGDTNEVREFILALYYKLENSKLRNQLIEVADNQHEFSLIEKNEVLRDFTFFLSRSSSEKMFKRGLKIYKRLSKQNEPNFPLLRNFMNHLLDSPFIKGTQGFIDLVHVLCQSCNQTPTHLKINTENWVKLFDIFKKNKIKPEAFWDELKPFFTFYDKTQFQSEYPFLIYLWNDFVKNVSTIFGGKVIQESLDLDYLKNTLNLILPIYFKQLFSKWSEDPERALKIYSNLENELKKVSLADYIVLFIQFINQCSPTEAFLLSGMTKIKEEGKGEDQTRIENLLKEKDFLRKFPKLRQHFNIASPKQVVVLPEAVSIIKSKDPIHSVDEVNSVMNLFTKIDVTTEKSLLFVAKYFFKTCERIMEFFKVTKGTSEALHNFLSILGGEENRCMSILESSKSMKMFTRTLLKLHITNLFIGHVYSSLIFAQDLETNSEPKIDKMVKCVVLHLSCYQKGWFSDKVFTELWKKILNAMLSTSRLSNIFVQLYFQIYEKPTVEVEVFQTMQLLLTEELGNQFIKQNHASYMEFALLLLGNLQNEISKKKSPNFPYNLAYEVTYGVLCNILEKLEANGAGPANAECIDLAGKFCSILNHSILSEDQAIWQKELTSEELTEFISKVEKLNTLLS